MRKRVLAGLLTTAVAAGMFGMAVSAEDKTQMCIRDSNNVGPYLAGILVQRRSGCNLVSYLMPRLFSHLGIRRPTWEEDPLGNTFGAGGLFLTLSELHKLGLFYLQKGSWEGRQLLNREWIMESTRKQVENGKEGYGCLLYTSRCV